MLECFVIFSLNLNHNWNVANHIRRPLNIEKIKPFIGKSLIIVLVGQRRVGKSFLLLQLIDLIKTQEPNTQIIYINKELNEYSFYGLLIAP